MNANVQRRMERMATAIQDAPEVAWKEPPRWLPPTFHALAYRDYLLLFIGQISNSLAMWMDLVARPVMVVALTGSPVQLGLIALARGVPMMFLGPIGGLVSDRFDRRIVMLFSKSLSMAVNVTFAAIIITGHLELWHIYATAILRSLLMAFGRPRASCPAPKPCAAQAAHQRHCPQYGQYADSTHSQRIRRRVLHCFLGVCVWLCRG